MTPLKKQPDSVEKPLDPLEIDELESENQSKVTWLCVAHKPWEELKLKPINLTLRAVLPSPGMATSPLSSSSPSASSSSMASMHVSFLNITTEASTAQTQLLHSPTLPVDISALVNEDTLILTRICINVEENVKPLKSILIELGKPQDKSSFH
ncbi:hypothetical protein CFP56_004567 [Quercus suber]|uniref:Uncharacterized protein n=1 Tax=Quercus suber TaxID=58331 RepID=A0AAW0LAH2_QUESU